ncbi:MAG: hypothetical protein R3F14_30590 [Polyangiaceae bacterium]
MRWHLLPAQAGDRQLRRRRIHSIMQVGTIRSGTPAAASISGLAAGFLRSACVLQHLGDRDQQQRLRQLGWVQVTN